MDFLFFLHLLISNTEKCKHLAVIVAIVLHFFFFLLKERFVVLQNQEPILYSSCQLRCLMIDNYIFSHQLHTTFFFFIEKGMGCPKFSFQFSCHWALIPYSTRENSCTSLDYVYMVLISIHISRLHVNYLAWISCPNFFMLLNA